MKLLLILNSFKILIDLPTYLLLWAMVLENQVLFVLIPTPAPSHNTSKILNYEIDVPMNALSA